MKILVIFTGGTIGCQAGDEYISLDGEKPYKLIEMYREKYGENAEFSTVVPYTILSENMDCKVYFKLAEAVKSHLDSGYDGIIVTHGSDTLQYSAAMLSYVLGSDTVPVMLVASNYVLEDERANGLVNFACAVEFIKGGFGRGVFVPYANPGENCRVHRAVRLMPHVPYSDYLYSLDNMYYGEFENDVFNINESNPKTGENTAEFSGIDWEDGGSSCSDIMWISVHPGIVCPDIPDNVKAVLISGYHSGTLCMEYFGLQKFLDNARNKSVPVYLTGAYEGMDYESCSLFEEYGIKVLEKASPVAVYIRLWLEYNCH